MAEIFHVEAPVTKYAKERGFFVRKCAWIGRRGAPDRLFFGYGVSFWIEFKDTGKEPEAHQQREIERMRQHGLSVHVIDTPEAGIALVDRYVARAAATGGSRLAEPAPEPNDGDGIL